MPNITSKCQKHHGYKILWEKNSFQNKRAIGKFILIINLSILFIYMLPRKAEEMSVNFISITLTLDLGKCSSFSLCDHFNPPGIYYIKLNIVLIRHWKGSNDSIPQADSVFSGITSDPTRYICIYYKREQNEMVYFFKCIFKSSIPVCSA